MAGEAGYAGKILKVDLSSGNISEVPTSEYSERFVGGRGIAAKLYWDAEGPEAGPLEPESPLVFATGPMAGLSGQPGARWQVCGKSPATIPQHLVYTNLGGSWGAYLKFAGYDAVVARGRADRPVYLSIQDGKAEIREASHLWGKDTVETREALKAELGQRTRVVAIGPGGENGVIFASLFADDDASAGGGMGAVMGAKHLKAV